MPHPSELIDMIKVELYRSYPPDRFEYWTEKRLGNAKIRIFPDIQVLGGSEVQCVVEIGYTRPEKLAEYKRMKIPDIRWYSKKGELINEREIHSVEERVVPREEEKWWGLKLCSNNFANDCYVCAEDQVDGFREDISEYFEAMLHGAHVLLANTTMVIIMILVLIEEDKKIGNILCDDIGELNGYLFTNGVRRFLVCTCDECGEVSHYGGDLTLGEFHLLRECRDVMLPLKTYDDFMCYESRLERRGELEKIVECETFSELSRWVFENWGIKVLYHEYQKWEEE